VHQRHQIAGTEQEELRFTGIFQGKSKGGRRPGVETPGFCLPLGSCPYKHTPPLALMVDCCQT
jgi:hypothetical protein